MWIETPFEKCIQKTKIPYKLSKKEYLESGEFPVVSQESRLISGYHNEPLHVFNVTKPVVIFGDHTQVLKYVDFDFVVGADGVKILLPHEGIDTKYFYYALKVSMPKAKGYARHYKLLKGLNIPIPPLAEQQRIVAKLDAAFAEIDGAIGLTEEKEAEIKQLQAALLSNSFNEEAVMFKAVKLGDILKTGAGGTPLKSKKEFYEGGAIKWLLSGAVRERDIEGSKTFITEEGLANSSAKLFPQNTVLVAMYGATAGQVGILRTEAATNQAVCGVYPSEDYLAEFLYYYLTNYKETLLLEVSGVAQPNLSQVKIKNIPLPLLSLAEQQSIVVKLDAACVEIYKAHSAIKQKKENYQVLKSAILKQELQSEAA